MNKRISLLSCKLYKVWEPDLRALIFLVENYLRVIPCQMNKFFPSFPLDHLRFWWKFHRMCINVLEHAVQNFRTIFLVVFFWRIFKDVWGDPVFRYRNSCLNFLPCLEGYNSSVIVDKWMKFAGHIVCDMLIKAWLKKFKSDE